MNATDHNSRILGGLYGSLVGDALGVPVEFRPRADRERDPVMGMRDYGTHGQPKGTWSDDGALLLCTAESIVEKGFDTEDMGERFVRWCSRGHWTATGVMFDIGHATRKALRLIEHGCIAEAAGGTEEFSNGNGSLMRILPVGLANKRESQGEFVLRLMRASSITHGHDRSRMACAFHGLVVRSLMEDNDAASAFNESRLAFGEIFADSPEIGVFRNLLQGDIAAWPATAIGSSGYVIDTLTASIWCLLTTNNFADCVLKAVNLGEDTDTTCCVAGGLAGVCYGTEAIPAEWCAALPRQAELRALFSHFLERAVAS
jgi:ADP-ribosyl-[dinitrogen reductase] hydrolase